MSDEPLKPALYAMAFIDGQNLYRQAKDAFGHYHPNYDVVKLHAAVCALRGWRPNLVRFYTGVPSAAENPMWAAYWSNRVLAMKRAGVHVTTRTLRYHKEDVLQADGSLKTVTVAHEKGIDVRLALDAVGCARTRQFDVAVIYSQDQDLGELVTELKAIAVEQGRHITVACAFPKGPGATSHRGIDKTDWVPLDQPLYDGCLDPRDYRSKTGLPLFQIQ